ncbi:MAG: hypothetical protein ACKOX6_02500 [Bdellovibrio sp.]
MKVIKSMLLLLPSFFLLASCSFTKSPKQLFTRESALGAMSVELSENQKKILAAVEQGNISALDSLIKNASVADYSFAGADKTPIGLALKNNFFEITQLLVLKKVDQFNLGDYEQGFRLNAFQYGLQRAFASLGHEVDDGSSGPIFNKSEKYLLSQVWSQLRVISKAAHEDDLAGARAIFFNAKMPCHFLEAQTILLNIESGNFEKLVSIAGCAQSVDQNEVRQLYLLSAYRAFQSLFMRTEFLSYLSRMPSLKSKMVFLDEFAIYVSPSLLLRISRSLENYSISSNYCKVLALDISQCMQEVSKTLNVERFLQEKHITGVSKDLVSRINYDSVANVRTFDFMPYKKTGDENYLIFKHEDPLFASISALLNGYDFEFYAFNPLRVHNGSSSESTASIAISEHPGESLGRLDEDGAPIFKKKVVNLPPLEDFEDDLK